MNNLLLDLARYGAPMMFLTNKKWVCCVDMTINISGAKFEVKGDGESPEAAVLNCHTKMISALNQLSSLKTPVLGLPK